jgi:guanylate kinase
VSPFLGDTFPVVLAAPSGTGKTTIARALVERSDHFVFSVSATTRTMRVGESGERDYRFVSREGFRGMVERGELAEWAEVHGHLYGTPREGLAEAREAGRFPILDIDVQGARQIRESVPEAILVFLLPPSAAELESRLRGRATERSPEVARRLRAAGPELDAAEEFDYVVVNRDVEDAVKAVEQIARGEAYRVSRRAEFAPLLATLRRDIDELLVNNRHTVPAGDS